MEIGKEKTIEGEQIRGEGKKGEGERGKKARGRPTKAEELTKLRGRTDSLGSVKDFVQKRKREKLEKEVAKAEKKILEKFNETRRVNRSPPAKIKKEEERRKNMATEELLKIIRKMEKQEKEKKKDKEEIKNKIKGLKEEFKKSEEIWKKQSKVLDERMKKLEEKVERMEVIGAEKQEGWEVIEKMKKIKRNLERAERRRKRNNIIVKKKKIGDDKERKERIEKLIDEINKTKGGIEEIQEIGYGDMKMRMFRCKSWESKRDIMMEKKELERRYNMNAFWMTISPRKKNKYRRKIAGEMRVTGKRITVGYQKIWVDSKEWKWKENKGRVEERNDFRGA